MENKIDAEVFAATKRVDVTQWKGTTEANPAKDGPGMYRFSIKRMVNGAAAGEQRLGFEVPDGAFAMSLAAMALVTMEASGKQKASIELLSTPNALHKLPVEYDVGPYIEAHGKEPAAKASERWIFQMLMPGETIETSEELFELDLPYAEALYRAGNVAVDNYGYDVRLVLLPYHGLEEFDAAMHGKPAKPERPRAKPMDKAKAEAKAKAEPKTKAKAEAKKDDVAAKMAAAAKTASEPTKAGPLL